MTIVASPERRSRKQKPLVSESSPLLPEKHQDGEDCVHEGFNGASFSGAVFNLSTTVVGAGIMALPATMKVLGLVLGILLIIFIGLLTDASIDILLRFSRAGAAASYGGVMGDAFGRIGKMLLQICVIINNLGILIVYMIIIEDPGVKISQETTTVPRQSRTVISAEMINILSWQGVPTVSGYLPKTWESWI